QLIDYFTYSVFAHTIASIAAEGINVSPISAEAAKELVNRHIVTNRHLFTDGTFTGPLVNKKGEYLTFSGAWDSFTVQFQNNVAQADLSKSNVLGSNGVVHMINKVL